MKNGLFAKMATKMACLVKIDLFGQKWSFESFIKVCPVGTQYACHEMSEDMQQKSVESNRPLLRKRLNI